MSDTVTLTVNGVKRTVSLEGWEKLLPILRDKIDLTGTKAGCDDASCGACVVVVNGEARRSCVTPPAKLEGADIVTIEGLSKGTDLHPIQQAMVDGGAVQCGYCIPGIIMELYALFSRNINASEEEIKKALTGHFCRCTGYETIWKSALLAQKYLRERNVASKKGKKR